MHRFFLMPDSFQGDTVTIRDPGLIHQLVRVLRMQPGQNILCLNSTGMEALTRIETIAKTAITGAVLARQRTTTEPTLRIALFQALPKQLSKFELVLQKGTEIGIHSFHPIITQRTERSDVSPAKYARLRKVLQEAAEQSGRGIIPELSAPISYGEALTALSLPAYIAYERAPQQFPAAAMKALPAFALFIGPEGGFSEEEIAQATARGETIFGLGPRILRTETAALAIASAILYG